MPQGNKGHRSLAHKPTQTAMPGWFGRAVVRDGSAAQLRHPSLIALKNPQNPNFC
jgi:hypothetical protein